MQHLHLSLACAVTISPLDWVQVLEGVCTDDLRKEELEDSIPDENKPDLAQSYVAMQVSGAIKCLEICNNVHGCIAFSLHDMTGKCYVTTSCSSWMHDSKFVTYVRSIASKHMVEVSSVQSRKLPVSPFLVQQQKQAHNADEGCTYCPPQNPCEQPRLCRAGQCFHNLKLKDGTPCDDGDPNRFGDVCLRGTCSPQF
jgi:hypothetical protein